MGVQEQLMTLRLAGSNLDCAEAELIDSILYNRPPNPEELKLALSWLTGAIELACEVKRQLEEEQNARPD